MGCRAPAPPRCAQAVTPRSPCRRRSRAGPSGLGRSPLHDRLRNRALRLRHRGATISDARVLTDHVPNPTVNEIFRELVLLRAENDLTWLVFDQDACIRALKVAPGCVYPPDPDPASIIEW